MSKEKYRCKKCGFVTTLWSGRCPACGEWDTLVPFLNEGAAPPSTPQYQPLSQVEVTCAQRIKTGIGEFDRVLGGGFFPGSVILIGGEPGIGKSTLLLQIASLVGKKVLYISGEESAIQIKQRADRLGIEQEKIFVYAEQFVDSIVQHGVPEDIDFVVLDSIQSVCISEIEGSIGTPSQLKEIVSGFTRIAKRRGIPVVLVGHVTKEGIIAGPKLVEHVVDVVLYLEGERSENYRVLRCVKNRFGPVNEIGLFEMTEKGLLEVKDPSTRFVSHSQISEIGCSIGMVKEGNRFLPVEFQSLVSKVPWSIPKRISHGFDINRLNLLLAVIENKAGLSFGNRDVYLSTMGGIRVTDPFSDLPVVVAVMSAHLKKFPPKKAIFVGEVGLTGEIRHPQDTSKREKEAQRLGYTLFKIKNLKQIFELLSAEI